MAKEPIEERVETQDNILNVIAVRMEGGDFAVTTGTEFYAVHVEGDEKLITGGNAYVNHPGGGYVSRIGLRRIVEESLKQYVEMRKRHPDKYEMTVRVDKPMEPIDLSRD